MLTRRRKAEQLKKVVTNENIKPAHVQTHARTHKRAQMAYGKQYYDLSHEAGYAGVQNLVRVNTKKDKPNEKARIYAWLSNQDAYTLHHPIKRKFPRLRYNVTKVIDVWECDLLQLTSIKDYNDGFCYILVVVDVLSKYAWIEPLRDKTNSRQSEPASTSVFAIRPWQRIRWFSFSEHFQKK